MAAARDVRMLNRMNKEEAAKAGMEDGKERFYFRSDTDGNLSPASATEWFHLTSVRARQRQRRPGRRSGLCRRRNPLEMAERLRRRDRERLSSAGRSCRGGAGERARKLRIGRATPIAIAMGLDATNKGHKAKIAAMLKTWIANGMFIVVEGEDEHREKRAFIEVGEAASD